jgi:predicted kinase
VIVAGPPGAGKTTLARRLAAHFCLARLGSDPIALTFLAALRESAAPLEIGGDFQRRVRELSQDLVFDLCVDHLRCGVSVVLDAKMDDPRSWERVDALRSKHPEIAVLPLLLACSWETCLERVSGRAADLAPAAERGSAREETRQRPSRERHRYLERLERGDVVRIDAARSADEVFAEARDRIGGCADDLRSAGP